MNGIGEGHCLKKQSVHIRILAASRSVEVGELPHDTIDVQIRA